MASAKSGGGGAPNAPPNGGAADAAATPASGEPQPRQARRAARARKPEVVQERPNRSRERSTTNSIRPSRSRARSAERGGETANTVRRDERASPSERAGATEHRPTPPEQPKADPRAIPDSVRDRFTQDGRRWYFPDGARAFRDHGRRLSTPSENAEVIASLVEIAKASRLGFDHGARKRALPAGGVEAGQARRARGARLSSQRDRARRLDPRALAP